MSKVGKSHAGRAKSTAASLCLLLLAAFYGSLDPLRAASFQHSYAVVIGIGNYSSSFWKSHRLPYARPDAEAVAQRLQSQGYIVTALYDEQATKHNIMGAFDALSNKLQPTDRVVVFISSHGTSKSTPSGNRGYIVPYDGSDYASYISDAELKDASSEMQTARHQLFIIDACYGGLMITRSGGVPPDVPNYLDEVTTRIAREVITAGGGDQEVLDSGPNGHSVFTNALLEGLSGDADFNRDGVITFAELDAYLVPRASNAYQTPETGALPGHGGGEYVFQSPRGRTATAAIGTPLPKIVIKKGDSDQVARAKDLLKASRFSEALPLFREAAANDDPEAEFYLGQMYYNGWGVRQSDSDSIPWLEKAATAENAEAMENLGYIYDYGQGVPHDFVKAKGLYERAAAAGNAEAMLYLAFMYQRGRGVPPNYAKVEEWYEKAAAAGNAYAMNSLGYMYDNGVGVTQDYAKAKDLYEKGAAAGNAIAMENLGYMYENGRGVTQDYAKARDWYMKSAAAGDTGSAQRLKQLKP